MTEKTTVYLDAADQRRLRALAAAQGRPAAALIREAISEYVARHAPQGRPKCIGAAHSGGIRWEDEEDLLKGFGED